jgi:SAM-dependent methyltransferase
VSAATAVALYGRALDGSRVFVRGEDGGRRALPVRRWLGPLGRADHAALERAGGPVLDIGCGPGRHVLALAHRGVLALGLDVAPAAVEHARSRGAAVVGGSVFDRVPGAGRWRSALLLDGNLGIGGRPEALLRRVGTLLAPDGAVICELEPPGAVTTSELIALEDELGTRSGWFAWARVGVDRIDPVARAASMRVVESWEVDGRWFAILRGAVATALELDADAPLA